jgi:chemosensory pili system protein ChpA (sensor histidine kinase/response regulator)
MESQQSAEAATCDTETPSVEALLNPSVNFPQFEGEYARADDAPQPEDPQARATGATPQSAPDRRAIKDDVDKQLLPIFLDEVRDLGPLVGEDLRHLRNEPNDVAAFDSLRRVLHTIKGGARMVGAIRLGELVHIMEGRLEGARECGALSPDVLDMLEAEFDRLTCGFDALQGDESESKSAAALAEEEDTTPALSSPQQERVGSEGTPSFSAHVRVAADALDRLLNQAGEISVSRGRVELEAQTFKQFLLELTDGVTRLQGQLKEIEIQAESRLQATQNQAMEDDHVFDPLEFDRFTRFQELTRIMAESLHDVTTVQHHLLQSLDEVQAALNTESRLNRALQEDLLRLRTVTFQNVAERLYRVARQAARETGKKAELKVAGEQTEVDRGVLEHIVAPLEHLVRNAVTHGIEAVDHRLSAGKPEAGKIHLMFRQETNNLLISLTDDGGGIDCDRIRAKALELGWLAAEEQPSASTLEQMILRPGFSTAREVSELAGRGIGLDVVANEVHALGGSLDIETERGCGTTFTIRVPLTLAVAKAVLVSAAGRRWAILSNLVEQVQEVPANKLADLCRNEEVESMGDRYPVFYLPQLLGDLAAPSIERSRHFLLLLRSGHQRVAVVVDQIAVNQDIVLKKIGPQLAGIPGVNGASVLPSGEVVLLVNPVPLVERSRGSEIHALETGNQQLRAAPLVMVIDDSLTVRNVTSRLLLRHGYRVSTARDGLDALQQIQETTPDVLLVDIEMPRMDGFELTKSLKASQRTAKLPIIMITSRLASKHREYAQQLGVDVYLGKPFAENELLGHVGQFTAPVVAA